MSQRTESDIDKNIKDGFRSFRSHSTLWSRFTHLETFNTVPGARHSVHVTTFLRLSSIKFFNFFQLFNFNFLLIHFKTFIKQPKNFLFKTTALGKRPATNPRLVILDSNRRKKFFT